jgi:dihydrofolate synthase/folylpolyglutamate synthase
MFKKYADAINWLMYEMPKTTKGVFKDAESLKRSQYLMEKLGSPHLKLKAIHVSGTSGKGGVTSYAASLLHQQGFKVGHNLSPHAKTINERIQINNQPISDYELLNLINQIKPVIDEMGQSDIGRPSYFETTIAMAFLYFTQQNVDYVATEVGVGGTFDTTNLLNPKGKICVINAIGLDHTKLLGETIEEIASQKAGIIKPHNKVVVSSQKTSVNNVFKDKADLEQASLEFFDNEDLKDLHIDASGTSFKYSGHGFKLKMVGAHNATNFCLSLMACLALAKQDGWQFDIEKTDIAENLELPFRFEIIKKHGKNFIFDGAHNLDKIRAVSEAAHSIKLNKAETAVIFGTTQTNQIKDIAKIIDDLASEVIICNFIYATGDMKKSPLSIASIRSYFGDSNVKQAPDPKAALSLALKNDGPKNVIVIGSFHLCDQVYRELLV